MVVIIIGLLTLAMSAVQMRLLRVIMLSMMILVWSGLLILGNVALKMLVPAQAVMLPLVNILMVSVALNLKVFVHQNMLKLQEPKQLHF